MGVLPPTIPGCESERFYISEYDLSLGYIRVTPAKREELDEKRADHRRRDPGYFKNQELVANQKGDAARIPGDAIAHDKHRLDKILDNIQKEARDLRHAWDEPGSAFQLLEEVKTKPAAQEGSSLRADAPTFVPRKSFSKRPVYSGRTVHIGHPQTTSGASSTSSHSARVTLRGRAEVKGSAPVILAATSKARPAPPSGYPSDGPAAEEEPSAAPRPSSFQDLPPARGTVGRWTRGKHGRTRASPSPRVSVDTSRNLRSSRKTIAVQVPL